MNVYRKCNPWGWLCSTAFGCNNIVFLLLRQHVRQHSRAAFLWHRHWNYLFFAAQTETCETLLECDRGTDCLDASVGGRAGNNRKSSPESDDLLGFLAVNTLTWSLVCPATSRTPRWPAQLHSEIWWTCWWRTPGLCTPSSSGCCPLLRSVEKTRLGDETLDNTISSIHLILSNTLLHIALNGRQLNFFFKRWKKNIQMYVGVMMMT